MIVAESNLDQTIALLEELAMRLSPSHLLPIMARILEREHKEMFNRGYRVPGLPFAETSPWWRRHMAGKGSQRTLKWTGRGQQSIQAVALADHVEVRGEAYLGLLDANVHPDRVHTETFPVIITGDGPNDWVKLGDWGGEDEERTRRIRLKDRYLFDVTDSDVTEMLLEALGEESSFMEYLL